MDFVKIRTHIRDHIRFLEAGPIARDLWAWGMLYAGGLETDAEIPTPAVLATAWGAGGKRNRKVAERLVSLGLWERTPNGFRILRWIEQGNVTKDELEERRKYERTKKAKRRNEQRNAMCPPGTPVGIPSGVPISPSISPSGRSDQGSRSEEASPAGRPPEAGTMPGSGAPPGWFDALVTSVCGTTGERLDLAIEWLGYQADAKGRGLEPSAWDAQRFLARSAKFAKSHRMREADRPRSGRTIKQRGSVDYHVDETGFDEAGTEG